MPWEEVGKLLSVLLVGLGGGAGGKWLLDAYKEWKKNQQKDQTVKATVVRRERAEAIAELNEIIDSLRQDLAKVDAKAEQALRNERECERKWIRAVEYIQYVMYEANRRGWDLRPYRQDGTDTHEALDSSVGERRKANDPNRRGPERRKSQQPGGDQGQFDLHGPDDTVPPPMTPTDDGHDGE